MTASAQLQAVVLEHALIPPPPFAELVPSTFAEIEDHEQLVIAGRSDEASYGEVRADKGTYYIATNEGVYFAGYRDTSTGRFRSKKEAVTVCVRPGDIPGLYLDGPLEAPLGPAFALFSAAPDEAPFHMWFQFETWLDALGRTYGSYEQAQAVAGVLGVEF